MGARSALGIGIAGLKLAKGFCTVWKAAGGTMGTFGICDLAQHCCLQSPGRQIRAHARGHSGGSPIS